MRANDKGGKRLQRLQGEEFVRRYLLHVLPTGIKLQGSQAPYGTVGLADARNQSPGHGVGPRVHGVRGQDGGGFVPVLQGGAAAMVGCQHARLGHNLIKKMG